MMDYKVAGKEKKWEIADLLIPWIPVLALFFLTAGLPFFWDTLQLASRHAHFFYETRFTSLFLPNDMDSGHIPVFGMYLAMVWQIFGRSLAVSHLAMLPFVAGILLFTRRVVDHFFKSRYNGVIVLFLVADATILAQITLVSPDVWILCFFTMALWAFVRKKRILLGAASVGLALTSMRGMMIVAAFFFTGLILECFLPEKKVPGRKWYSPAAAYFFRMLPVYLPAAILSALYLGLHFLRTGWIGYHPDMPWYDHFTRVDLLGFVRNVFIFGWRLVDHGRIFIWITAVALAVYAFRKHLQTDAKGRLLIIFTLVLGVVFSYSALTYKNLSGHRYLIPLFFMVALSVIYHLHLFSGIRRKPLVLLLLLAALLSGNFWVYPDPIAKGWDASLAYLPYQQMRREMNCFIDAEGIDYAETATSFPNNIALKYLDLSDDARSFATIGGDPSQYRYILYSNVFNDFPEELPRRLEKEWVKVKEFRRVQVRMVLYRNPAPAGKD
ncbi:MAG: hypothetical protein WBK43_02515 [Prolixibacteraceae bacterium]|jgi:hypothetical protein|nr:hypothetical protein [Bacteroidota bacterium]NLS98579.1 hypothetical protein [Bacteroidales bacterium]HNU77317.1 hypothetical protein [Prolixibacteraceae bacterium]HNZ69596.1 hypothetical protein [Prolixibacteraceae bacterium]HOC86858.1 hypothetical protein [Prolixibacteraceae bacterium]